MRVVKSTARVLMLVLLCLQASTYELLLLVMFLSSGVLVFSTLVFWCERENMGSIPEAFWWAIVTMTTVGYGDMVPKSFPGKVVGSLCAVSGVVLIAITIPVLVNNFLLFYGYSKVRETATGPDRVWVSGLTPVCVGQWLYPIVCGSVALPQCVCQWPYLMVYGSVALWCVCQWPYPMVCGSVALPHGVWDNGLTPWRVGQWLYPMECGSLALQHDV